METTLETLAATVADIAASVKTHSEILDTVTAEIATINEHGVANETDFDALRGVVESLEKTIAAISDHVNASINTLPENIGASLSETRKAIDAISQRIFGEPHFTPVVIAE